MDAFAVVCFDGEGYSSAEGYFGMQEMMNLPDGVELWTNGEQIVSGGELVITQSVIDIVNPETGVVIAYIAAPYAYDNSFEVDNKEEITKEELLDVLEPSTKYFVSFEDNVVTITTAVNLDWLLSDYTSFPVVIDPSVGSNTVTGATTPGSYKVCVVADNDCHTKTDGRFLYDWTSDGGYHQESPRFDFTFTQTTPYSVGSVSAVYEISSQYSPSGEYGGLIIMEDCGSTAPNYPSTPNLNSIHNPSACTGVPLADYPAPPAPPAPPVMHMYSAEETHILSQFYDECHGW